MSTKRLSKEAELIVSLTAEYGILTIPQVKRILSVIPEETVSGLLLYLRSNRYITISEDENYITSFGNTINKSGITHSLWYVINEIDKQKKKNNEAINEGKTFMKVGDFSCLSKSKTPTGILFFDSEKTKTFEVISVEKDNISIIDYLNIETKNRVEKFGSFDVVYVFVVNEEEVLQVLEEKEIFFSHKVALINYDNNGYLGAVKMLELE